jgi:chromosome segregation ATPase
VTTTTSATKSLAIAELQLRLTRLEIYRQQAWQRAMTRTRKTRHHADEDVWQWARHKRSLAKARAQLATLEAP